ncbi:C4-dicarboxylate ABC transporter [Marinomonas ushuaiensis DSM 15871]|uniref:C4-dicarboxylate ABC transporter n=1 Tax=Marinomonas ushuaiensis DSM 15871 TaxID=1122207 RepID=X7E8E2_9GAMM|nr:TRAP transporter substrate-binding protein [Marinomonas ushuaiensis]ETX12130.1 C4-dicarboxylate ABC transporter [Marinomonas ushuaiensis DSM 15871]
MNKIKIWLKVALLALTATVLVACGEAEEKVTAQAEQKAEVIHWKMVTTWPKNAPGVGTGAENLAKNIKEMSNGRLDIKVYGAGELVPALEAFDAVSRGTAEMGHGASYYWKGKVFASQFFTTVPFGLNAQEFNAWISYGGGLALWEEIYAPFNVIPMVAGNAGVQMGGWFNKEINSLEDFKGLKMRMPGLGGEVLKKVGASPINLPASEVFTALQTGAIDATEWVGPYNDLAFGLYKAAKYYYYPGWHEPGSAVEAIFNKDAFEVLPKDLKAIVRSAVQQANLDMLNEFTARNNAALQTLVNEHKVILKPFPEDLLVALKKASFETLEETAANDPESKKVFDSLKAFMGSVSEWHDVSERAFINARSND